uniref:Capsid protein n=1 Tax=Psittacidae Chaphamaparvovirus TaxID=2794494 RepID=A0A8A4XDU3_9VIRU|nr:MAG: capsid protein [Psittacidae Chaphamaparvovirus]
MAEKHTISNCYSVYFGNAPYVYPSDATPDIFTTAKINTGWHVAPNLLWRHFVSPKQWAELNIAYEAYHVDSISCTVFNMIPMTTQLAIQGTSVFTAFNNTIYALGYTDELYETSWEPWTLNQSGTGEDNLNKYGVNLAWKEGQIQTPGSNNTYMLNKWPVYLWKAAHTRTTNRETWANWYAIGSGDGVWACGNQGNCWPSGMFWDPMNMPDKLQELRPGKNAISFSWNTHPCDDNKWYNLDQLISWYPWTPTGPYRLNTRPGQILLSNSGDPDRLATQNQGAAPLTGTSVIQQQINDYTIPNLALQPIVPFGWWFKELQNSLVQERNINQADLWFCGTEAELYKYPPHQWFVKMIPLFNESGQHIEVHAQCSVKISISLQCKKRRSAYFGPTWGPFNWRNTYSAQTPMQCYQPSMARYRTGGMRRSWQNITQEANQQWTVTGHPREDPYQPPTCTVASGTGVASTILTYTTTTAPIRSIDDKNHLPQNIQAPVPQKRRAQREKTQEPETSLAIKDLTFFPHLTDTQL